MSLKYGDHVSSGYVIQVTSWENDGDDYETNEIQELTLDEVEYFKQVLPLFASINNGGSDVSYGNDDFNEGLIFDIANLIDSGKITEEFSIKHLGIHLNYAEILENTGEVAGVSVGSIITKLHKFLGVPANYDYDFIRVVEKYSVLRFSESFTIPSPDSVHHYTLRD